MLFRLISRNNGVGLSKDIKILSELIKETGNDYIFCDIAQKNDKKEYADINIFCELMSTHYVSYSRGNWLVPNPEWFEPRWKALTARFDLILCKTCAAVDAFANYNRVRKYTSFTSDDKFDPTVLKTNNWLHVAGKSHQKGTNKIIETWHKHDDLPHLTIVQQPACKKDNMDRPNLTVIYDYLPDEQLKYLQNSCGVHLCPSETEGFGHYLMEAMSCKAITVTTNAEPMNELVNTSRGILCPYTSKSIQKLATNYYVSESDIIQTVEQVKNIPLQELELLRENARQFYLENDMCFRNAFKSVIQNPLPYMRSKPLKMMLRPGKNRFNT